MRHCYREIGKGEEKSHLYGIHNITMPYLIGKELQIL